MRRPPLRTEELAIPGDQEDRDALVLVPAACPGWTDSQRPGLGPLRSSGAMLPDARAGGPLGLQIEDGPTCYLLAGWPAGAITSAMAEIAHGCQLFGESSSKLVLLDTGVVESAAHLKELAEFLGRPSETVALAWITFRSTSPTKFSNGGSRERRQLQRALRKKGEIARRLRHGLDLLGELPCSESEEAVPAGSSICSIGCSLRAECITLHRGRPSGATLVVSFGAG